MLDDPMVSDVVFVIKSRRIARARKPHKDDTSSQFSVTYATKRFLEGSCDYFAKRELSIANLESAYRSLGLHNSLSE